MTLALGIGGNTTVFTIVERVLVRSLPFQSAGRLVRINDTLVAPGGQFYRPQVLPWHWQGIAMSSHSLDRLVAIRPERLTWIGGEAPIAFQGSNVSAGTFELLGVTPQRGRLFTKQEERLGERSSVALISDRFWTTRLGRREAVLGAPLRLADRTVTIVGVFPAGYQFPYSSDVWRPLTIEPTDTRDLFTIGRLAPGATLAAANAELRAIAQRQEREGPTLIKGRGIDAVPLKDGMMGGGQRIPLTLMAAVGFLLLLACANLASLLLARSVVRQREVAICITLGASRARLVRQSLVEALLLALVGGAIGLLLAGSAAGPISALVPRVFEEDLPVVGSRISPTVALFALGLSLVTGLFFGLLPAWRSSRADYASALKGGRSSSLSAGTRRLLSGFVVVEIALATLLLSGGALMVADFRDRQNRDLGLRAEHLLSVEVPLRNASEESLDQRRKLVNELLGSAVGIPGVASAAVVTANPFSERRWGVRIAPERSVDPTRELSTVNLRLATPGLFRTYGTPLLAGRDLAEGDRPDSLQVAVVSQNLARRFWHDEDPIGKRLVRRAPDSSLVGMTVVGVVGNIRENDDLQESIYLPYEQVASLETAGTIYLMVRGAGSANGWARHIPPALKRVDSRLGVAESGFMDALYQRVMRQNRVGTSIVVFLGAFGLLLAAIGIVAIVSFVAVQRRAELGIRAALGATPFQIRRLILGHGFLLALGGSMIGLPLALVANRLLSGAINDFASRPWLCALLAVTLLLLAVVASDRPASKAARQSPAEALRSA